REDRFLPRARSGRPRGGGLWSGRSGLRLRLVEALEIEASRRFFGIERLDLKEELSRRVAVPGLESLAPVPQEVGDPFSFLGHLLPGLLDSRHGLGVVDVDEKYAGPDLDRLLAVPFACRVVAPLQEAGNVPLRGFLIGRSAGERGDAPRISRQEAIGSRRRLA